jgi:hypothetical protein
MSPSAQGFEAIRHRMEVAAERERLARKSYPLNLLLLIAAVLLMAFWVYRHIDPLIRQISIISTVLTVCWLMFRTLQNWVDSPAFREPPRTWTRRYLAQPYSRPILVGVVLLAVGLLTVTRSIFFEYDTQHGNGAYTVELKRNGHLEMPPCNVNSYEAPPGRLFMNPFEVPAEDSLIALISDPPFRYNPLPVSADILSRRIQVPTDFEPRTNRAFRIVPGNVLTKLRPVNSIPPQETTLYFDILVNDKSLLESPLPLFHEATYFGGPREMIELLISDERASGRLESNTIAHMTDLALTISDEKDRSRIERRARLLAQSWNIVPTEELSVGDAVTVAVYTRAGDRQLFTVQHKVSKDAGIRTIILNPTGEVLQ